MPWRLLAEFRRQAPGKFAWRQPPYEYEHERMPVDILYGSDALRTQVDAGAPAGTIAARWAEGLRRFQDLRARCLLY